MVMVEAPEMPKRTLSPAGSVTVMGSSTRLRKRLSSIHRLYDSSAAKSAVMVHGTAVVAITSSPGLPAVSSTRGITARNEETVKTRAPMVSTAQNAANPTMIFGPVVVVLSPGGAGGWIVTCTSIVALALR